MRRNIARDLAGLALTILGALAALALGTLLASRGEWVAMALLVGSAVGIGAGVWLGRYDPDAAAPRAQGLGDDQIEMRPVVRGEGETAP